MARRMGSDWEHSGEKGITATWGDLSIAKHIRKFGDLGGEESDPKARFPALVAVCLGLAVFMALVLIVMKLIA